MGLRSAVGQGALGKLPNSFVRVEFRRVAGEPKELEPREGALQRSDRFSPVDRSVVPDQEQRPFALRGQPGAGPGQEVLGHLADRAASDESEHHPAGVGPQDPVAGQRLGIAIGGVGRRLLQPHRLTAGPGVQAGQGQPAPPGLILEAQDPIGVGQGQADQPVPRFFFRA